MSSPTRRTANGTGREEGLDPVPDAAAEALARRPLPERLRDALVAVVPGRPDALDALEPLYDRSVVFRDPIQVLVGLDAFLAMNRRLLRRLRRLTWDVHVAQGDDSLALLEWTMRGTLKLGPRIEVSGMTRARARGGRVVDHRDYWDVGELVASALPGGPRILGVLRSPMA